MATRTRRVRAVRGRARPGVGRRGGVAGGRVAGAGANVVGPGSPAVCSPTWRRWCRSGPVCGPCSGGWMPTGIGMRSGMRSSLRTGRSLWSWRDRGRREQPPGFVAFLGGSPAIVVERRRQLLQSAVSRRSGGPRTADGAGQYLPVQNHEGGGRAVAGSGGRRRRPGHVAAHTNLGNTLADKGQLDEAIACFRQAIELDPKLALVHSNPGQG